MMNKNTFQEFSLEDISKKFIELSYPDTSSELKEAMIYYFQEELKKKITEEEKQNIEIQVKKELKEIEKRKKVNELKSVIIEVFILSFLVGLFTNQITDFISYVKSDELVSSRVLWITSICSLMFGGSACFILFKKVYDAISSLLSNDD